MRTLPQWRSRCSNSSARSAIARDRVTWKMMLWASWWLVNYIYRHIERYRETDIHTETKTHVWSSDSRCDLGRRSKKLKSKSSSLSQLYQAVNIVKFPQKKCKISCSQTLSIWTQTPAHMGSQETECLQQLIIKKHVNNWYSIVTH